MTVAYRVIDELAKMADLALPLGNGPLRFSTATNKFSTAPTRTVLASDIPNVVLDATADAAGCYGTNNSAAINGFWAAGPGTVVINGPCLVDTLLPRTGCNLRGLHRSSAFGLYRKNRPNGGRTMILNANPVLGPTAPADQFIEISDLYIDGNQRGYGSGNTGTHMAGYDDETFQHVFNDSGYIVHEIGLYGVRFFRVGNIYVYDPTGFALNLGNCQDGHVHDFSKYRRPGHLVTYDPIVQVQGHCHRIDFDRIGGEAMDDALAVNANDGQDDPSATVGPEPGQVAPGPISNLTFRDCDFDGVMQVCRFLSAKLSNSIKDVTFDGVRARLGYDVNYAFAAFLIDDFGLTGPLTDGTHGLVDGVKLLNIDVSGNNTGAGEGFASVHMDRCNVKRLEIRNYRYRGYSLQPIAVVHSTPNAKVETLVLEKVVNESILPIAPVLTLKGNHQVVMVDGAEYDMLAAGPDYPQPQFRDVEMIRVAGPVKSLIVGKARGAGLSHLVKMIGFAPANLSLTGSSLLASNGGAAVKSDTPLPWLQIAGVDADHCEDVPAGSMIKSDGSGRYDNRFLRDLFGGTANALIAGSTATDGSIWQADTAGANQLKASGNGTAFLGGASSFTAAAAAAQPTTPSFTVKCQFVRLSSVAGGDGLGHTLFATSASSLADSYKLMFRGASFDLMHNTTVLATSGTIPAVGGTRWTRTAVYAVPGTNDKRITVDYSDDVGRSWANLIPTTYVTTATPALVGLRGESTAGWTATTGHHVGSIVASSYSEPVPGPYVPPVTTPVFNLMADAGTLQTVGGTPATANNDPVGQWLDQSGNAHHASIATAGYRPLLKTAVQNGLPVLRFDGVDDRLIVPSYTPTPPFTLFVVFKMTAAVNVELIGWGNNIVGGNCRFGVWLSGDGKISAENAGSVRVGTASPSAGAFHLLTLRLPDATFANLTQRINGATDAMTGGSGTVAFSDVTELRVCGVPTVDAYYAGTDVAEIYLVGSSLADLDCVTVEAALKTKWGTP